MRAGARIRHWDICDQAGVILTETDLAELWNGVGAFVGIERSRLQQVLLSAASDVPLRTGISIFRSIQDDDRVEVTFTDETRAEYDLVVAPMASIHRAALAFGRRTCLWMSDGLAQCRGRTDRLRPAFSFTSDEGCFFGLCPVSDNRTYGFGNM